MSLEVKVRVFPMRGASTLPQMPPRLVAIARPAGVTALPRPRQFNRLRLFLPKACLVARVGRIERVRVHAS
jgi:hypothetical protein